MVPYPVTVILERMLPPTATLRERRQSQVVVTAILLAMPLALCVGVLNITITHQYALSIFAMSCVPVLSLLLALLAKRRVSIRQAYSVILFLCFLALAVSVPEDPHGDEMQVFRLLVLQTIIILLEPPAMYAFVGCVLTASVVAGQLIYGHTVGQGLGSALSSVTVAEALCYVAFFVVGTVLAAHTRAELMTTVTTQMNDLQKHQDFEHIMQQFLFHELRNPLVVARGALEEGCRMEATWTTATPSRLSFALGACPSEGTRSSAASSQAEGHTAMDVYPSSVDADHAPGTDNRTSHVSLMCAGLQATESIGKMLSDVQDVLRLRAGGVVFVSEEVPLRDVLNMCVSEVVDQIGVSRRRCQFGVTWECSVSNPIIRVDRQALEKILKHLIHNAMVFGKNEAKLIVRCDQQISQSFGDNPSRAVGQALEHSDIEISVQNDGRGMTDEQLDHAFDMFCVRSHRRGGGTGLGLVECKLLAEAIGAELVLKSKEGDTRANLRLPGPILDQKPAGEQQQQQQQLQQQSIPPDRIISPRRDFAALSVNKRESLSRVDGPRAALLNIRHNMSGALPVNPLHGALHRNNSQPNHIRHDADQNDDSGPDGIMLDLMAENDNSEADKTAEDARRILFVDDVPMNRIVGVRMLEMCQPKGTHMEIDTASDGKDAVAKFRAALDSGRKYDVVFMDVTMPVMNGWEATEEIRKMEREHGVDAPEQQQRGVEHDDHGKTERCTIIAVTGNTLPEDVERCLDAGMDDVFFKPYKIEQLSRVLEQ